MNPAAVLREQRVWDAADPAQPFAAGTEVHVLQHIVFGQAGDEAAVFRVVQLHLRAGAAGQHGQGDGRQSTVPPFRIAIDTLTLAGAVGPAQCRFFNSLEVAEAVLELICAALETDTEAEWVQLRGPEQPPLRLGESPHLGAMAAPQVVPALVRRLLQVVFRAASMQHKSRCLGGQCGGRTQQLMT
eukprot:TRINITY_DN1568_c1_g2_i2.p2 TRINITY_DN1568_c1_g2~~TRINITY_DN1568_c1_g2_i2.p2  ORF type:complete len:194 (+),score=57.90 TRINITY_DN1568_c1_g2_i2:25-582(+)